MINQVNDKTNEVSAFTFRRGERTPEEQEAQRLRDFRANGITSPEQMRGYDSYYEFVSASDVNYILESSENNVYAPGRKRK